MKTGKNIEKLNKIISKEQSGWHDDAKMREENAAWLSYSFKIAVSVLSALRSKSITQKELAEKMNVSPQHINKIVKGQENLSLETISKLEKALGITLISIPITQKNIEIKYSPQLPIQSKNTVGEQFSVFNPDYANTVEEVYPLNTVPNLENAA